jgi:hypothetical protein
MKRRETGCEDTNSRSAIRRIKRQDIIKMDLGNLCCENVNQKMMIHVEYSSKIYLKLVSSKFDGGGFQENLFPGVWTRRNVPMAGFSVTCAGHESTIRVTKEHVVRVVEIMLRVWNRRLSWRSRSSAVELIEKRLVQINCKYLKI